MEPAMKAEWIDGAVRVPEVRWVNGRLVEPDGKTVQLSFLIRIKGFKRHFSVEWDEYDENFTYPDLSVERNIIYKPETVEWLEITEEQS